MKGFLEAVQAQRAEEQIASWLIPDPDEPTETRCRECHRYYSPLRKRLCVACYKRSRK